MTSVEERPRTGRRDRPGDGSPGPGRRAGELGARELLRWVWRQVTSMRTALVLLLLLALAAVPGSVIPQERVDAFAVSQWQDQYPTLTPVFEQLGLFSVYDSAWFSAIYLLLMVSLVGCIVPRTFHYLKQIRAQPPAAPRRLDRLPDHTAYTTDEEPEVALERAREVLRGRRYRLRRPGGTGRESGAVSAERGYLREVGNLVFHMSVIVLLVGFAIGALFGYQGGVIVVTGQTFTNTAASYDDFDPGSQFGAEDFDPFTMTVEDFDVSWLTEGSAAGTARDFSAQVRYREGLDAQPETYDLRVNHPLDIGDTSVFLIGHGYAPVITVRDGEGNLAYSGPTVFLPQDPSFLSIGVVKAASAQPAQIGLEGLFFPTFGMRGSDPVTVFPAAVNPLVSMTVWTGDLGLDEGPQSVYVLDTSEATRVTDAEGEPLRLDLALGETKWLPDGMGSVTFEDVKPWVRVQISQTPGKFVALGGVVLALLGLLGSLYVRSRRVWVRARREGGVTMVDLAALDRSGGSDLSEVLEEIVAELRGDATAAQTERPADRPAERRFDKQGMRMP